MLVWVAVLKDDDLSCDEVLCVQTSFAKLETYVKDWFGISETKKYTKPAECLGYTKIEYSEFEDDLDGYFTFKEEDEFDVFDSNVSIISKVYVFCKALDQEP
jgi:hypothetical protein